MANKYVNFISDKHLLTCVENLHKSYLKAKNNISKKSFYTNKVDTIKLTFDAKFNEIDQLYKSFKAEAVLLPDDIKSKREDEIIELIKRYAKKRGSNMCLIWRCELSQSLLLLLLLIASGGVYWKCTSTA